MSHRDDIWKTTYIATINRGGTVEQAVAAAEAAVKAFEAGAPQTGNTTGDKP
jgi:hypothetical protein